MKLIKNTFFLWSKILLLWFLRVLIGVSIWENTFMISTFFIKFEDKIEKKLRPIRYTLY